MFQDGKEVERSKVHGPVRGKTAGPGARWELEGLLAALKSFYFYLLMKWLWQYELFLMDYWSIWSNVVTDVYKFEEKKMEEEPKEFYISQEQHTQLEKKKCPFYLYVPPKGSYIHIKKAELFPEAINQLSNHS